MKGKKSKISSIRDGTVIDHIDTNVTLDILNLLTLKRNETITLGLNFYSKKSKRKGLIKISNKNLDKVELSKISLISPNATINVIENYKVLKKCKIEIPDEFRAIGTCGNVNCVTNHQDVNTFFYVTKKDPLTLKCKYCEKIFDNYLNILSKK